MVTYLPRSAWGARAPRGGPGNLTPSSVEGETLHWPGMGNRRLSRQSDVAAALRGWQDYHMDGRGWSDIAYQVAVDQAGRAWTLRGHHEQSGANGNNPANEAYGAVLLIVGTGEEPTPELIATTREVIADFRAIYPKGTKIRPHSSVREQYTGASTDCPGDAVRALIEAGAFEPGHNGTQEELTMADVQAILDYQKACAIQIQNNTRQHANRVITEVGKLVQTYAVAVNDFTRQTDAGSDAQLTAGLAALQSKLEQDVQKVLEALPTTDDAEAPELPQ